MLDDRIKVQRLTALWALSEAAFGGVLHAFQVPFTGLFINGASVVFITLIAFYGQSYKDLLKATLIVLIIKATVSPHTPINAYFALTVQGALGSLLLRSKKRQTLGALILGVLTLLQSALQRILVLTVIFGMNLWESINIFGNYVLEQFSFLPFELNQIDFSFWLVLVYVFIHVFFGGLIGFFASRIPAWVEEESTKNKDYTFELNSEIKARIGKKRKGKKWLKPSGIIILLLATAIVILSYVFPEFSASQGQKAIIMIVRSVVIMLIWYLILGPFFRKLYFKYLKSKEGKYASEIDASLAFMPVLRTIVARSWSASSSYSGYKRLKRFSVLLIFTLFTVEIQDS